MKRAKVKARDEQMRALAASGKTRRQIAEALAMDHGYTCSRLRVLGIDVPRGKPTLAFEPARPESAILADLARQLSAVVRRWDRRLARGA